MTVIQNMKVKPHKLKINATMSAICSKNNLIPNKVLTVIKDRVSGIKDKVCYGNLVKIDDSEVDFVILPNPDTLNLKKIVSENSSEQLQKAIRQYAIDTLDKTYCPSLDKRINELRGIIKSLK
jgi:hypothetical protein